MFIHIPIPFCFNKERFFLIFNDNVKFEITLNLITESGKRFYKELKESKTIQLNFKYEYNYFSGSINMIVEGDWNSVSVSYGPGGSGAGQKGEIKETIFSWECRSKCSQLEYTKIIHGLKKSDT